jgi:hypothetical protein
MKAAKKAGSEAYKAYIAENKKDAVLMSEFSRMKKLDGKTTLLYVISSVLILAYAVQLFLGELERVLISYNGVGDIFKSLITYIFLTALLSVLFFVQFSASPKAAAKGKFWMIISFAPAIFYTLLVFYTFRIHSGIISKVFVTFDFLKIAAIGLALVCLPQLFASSQRKNVFFSVSLCAVFLSALRLTDGVVSVLVSMGLGNGVLPVISHLDKIEIEPLLALGDFFLSVALLLTAVRVCKKTKKKVEAPTTENADAAAVTEEAAEVSDASAPTVLNEQDEVAEEEAVSEEIVAEEEPAPTEADIPQDEITVDEAPSEEEKSE